MSEAEVRLRERRCIWGVGCRDRTVPSRRYVEPLSGLLIRRIIGDVVLSVRPPGLNHCLRRIRQHQVVRDIVARQLTISESLPGGDLTTCIRAGEKGAAGFLTNAGTTAAGGHVKDVVFDLDSLGLLIEEVGESGGSAVVEEYGVVKNGCIFGPDRLKQPTRARVLRAARCEVTLPDVPSQIVLE